MRVKRGTVLMAAGLLLLLGAFALTGYNIQDEKRADAIAAEHFDSLKTEIVPLAEQNLPERMIPDFILDPNREMPVEEIDGQSYVGYISIPALELDLPVLSEWSYPNLKIGPCRYVGTPYKEGMVIAAHNYRSHFGGLQRVAIGDTVEFTDVDGYVFTYTVAGMEWLRPSQTAEMISEDWDLTLFTCTLGGRQRFTLRCVRDEESWNAMF